MSYTMAQMKRATLNLMSLDGDDLRDDSENAEITSLEEDENYAPYLFGFNDAFNRGLSRIVEKKKMPLVRLQVAVSGDDAEVDLTDYATDIYAIDEIIFKNGQNNKRETIKYQNFSDRYIEIEGYFNGTMNVYYHRSIPRVDDDNDLVLSDIGLTDELVAILEQYIVSELYLGDDANIAQLALNKFEAFINDSKENTTNTTQNVVSTVWQYLNTWRDFNGKF